MLNIYTCYIIILRQGNSAYSYRKSTKLVNIIKRKYTMAILNRFNFERISAEKCIHYFMNN